MDSSPPYMFPAPCAKSIIPQRQHFYCHQSYSSTYIAKSRRHCASLTARTPPPFHPLGGVHLQTESADAVTASPQHSAIYWPSMVPTLLCTLQVCESGTRRVLSWPHPTPKTGVVIFLVLKRLLIPFSLRFFFFPFYNSLDTHHLTTRFNFDH